MEKIATLTGHTFRVLYLAMNPDGSSIVTGAGDERLRFWNVFPKARSSKIGPLGGPSIVNKGSSGIFPCNIDFRWGEWVAILLLRLHIFSPSDQTPIPALSINWHPNEFAPFFVEFWKVLMLNRMHLTPFEKYIDKTVAGLIFKFIMIFSVYIAINSYKKINKKYMINHI